MGFFKKNLLKVIEWRDNSKNIIVYRFPIEDDRYEIMTGSTLIVREGQIAIFMHKGKVADIFQPGTHKLTTSNLPFLSKLLAWPTGGEMRVQADVYFVNTRLFTGQKWGTQNPIIIRDKDFGVVRVRGYGMYSFTVSDAHNFMTEMFGTKDVYTVDDVNDHIRPILIQSITDTIAESKISLLDLASNYKEFGESVVEQSEKEFAPIGITLEKLVVENISLPDEVERALDERSKLGIMKDEMGTYAQYQAATALRDSAKNTSGNNYTGIGVGLGTVGAISNVFNNAFNSIDNKTPANTKVCIKCGAQISDKAKHCPECGALQKATCPHCGEPVSARAKFCANCGQPIVKNDKKVCADCGEELKPSAKFCPNCGKKH